ncbi:MAG: hypothetical protein ACSHYB_13330 [Roseibacillus sp.]
MFASATSSDRSSLFRVLVSACLAVFAAWVVLPTCECQLEALLGKASHTESASSDSTVVTIGLPSDSNCHCLDAQPDPFASDDEVTLKDGPQTLVVSATDCGLEQSLSGVALSALSNRGPPNWHLVGFAEGRSYLAHCAFLL